MLAGKIHMDVDFAASNKTEQSGGTPRKPMLEILIVLLFLGWALGFFAFHLGAFIHIILVAAVIVLLLRLIRGGARAL